MTRITALSEAAISPPSVSKPADPRLAHAAHQFEASLMGELLKPMQQVSGLAGDEEQEEGSSSALSGFATDALAQVLSERGGFGIARRVLHVLHGTRETAVHASSAPQVSAGT